MIAFWLHYTYCILEKKNELFVSYSVHCCKVRTTQSIGTIFVFTSYNKNALEGGKGLLIEITWQACSENNHKYHNTDPTIAIINITIVPQSLQQENFTILLFYYFTTPLNPYPLCLLEHACTHPHWGFCYLEQPNGKHARGCHLSWLQCFPRTGQEWTKMVTEEAHLIEILHGSCWISTFIMMSN